jgi:gamma-glutamyltranspeptidase/glutathione hydrolase
LKGAIAAGHPKTAEAGTRMYESGGNAFDAALAALAAACVVEPVLTSLGGGGFLLSRRRGEPPVLHDFFVQTPRHKRAAEDSEFYPITADFGTAQQEFHIGCGSIAAPGTVRGLIHCHRVLGSLPLREILSPAIEYAREGVEVNALQAYIFGIVAPIYRATPPAAALYGTEALKEAGKAFHQPALADTLAWLAEEGQRPFYEGELAERLVALCAEHGGHLNRDDLRGYRVIDRVPLRHRYRGYEVATNPLPSSGGTLINFALTALEGQVFETEHFGRPGHLLTLAQIMAATNSAREDGLLARSAHHRETLKTYLEAVTGRPLKRGGTTHISAIDTAGNSASLTLSNGEGSGHLLPGTGVMLNNMLGEEDLNPGGFNRWPTNVRVGSMMAPTLAEDRRHLIAIGSGGSNRLRTAILQTLSNLIDFGMSPKEAVNAPRLHLERGHLDIEPGFTAEAVEALRAAYPNHRLWSDHNLFFGGTHTVCWDGRQFTIPRPEVPGQDLLRQRVLQLARMARLSGRAP